MKCLPQYYSSFGDFKLKLNYLNLFWEMKQTILGNKGHHCTSTYPPTRTRAFMHTHCHRQINIMWVQSGFDTFS